MASRALVFGAILLVLDGCNSNAESSRQESDVNISAAELPKPLAPDATSDPSMALNSAVDPVDQNNPKESALSIIQDAGHDCTSVVSVRRLSDSSLATCDDGEQYRISRVTVGDKTATLAMKCSALEANGISCL